MRCTITGEPYTVFGYGGKQVRDNIHSADLVRALRGVPAAPRAAPPSTTSAAAGDSNCSMLEAIAMCERIAGRELRLDAERRGPRSATTAGGSATSAPFERDYPGWTLKYDVEAILREIHDAERRALAAACREALGRHPGPQRGGDDRARPCWRSRATSTARRSTTRSSSSTTRASDGTAAVVERVAARSDRVRCLRSHFSNGFGFAVRAGLEAFDGRRRRDLMADGSDDPADLCSTTSCSRRATTARSGRASCRGRRHGLPAPQAGDQPGRELRASACCSGTATTTRPTPSRPTGAR